MVGVRDSSYEELLIKLGSSNKSTLKRKREEPGDNNIGNEEDDCMTCDVSEKDHVEGSTLSSYKDIQEDVLHMEGEDDLEDTQTDIESVGAKSYFRRHLEYSLSEAEISKIKMTKWKFHWAVPALDKPSSKWLGTDQCFLKVDDGNVAHGLKPQLYRHWQEMCNGSASVDFHSSRQWRFFLLCSGYRDILHPDKKPFYLKGKEDSDIMDAYLMHSLNHTFRTRDLVTKDNAKLAKLSENNGDTAAISAGLLDHGFTRPKVLILLPLRSIALRVVKRLIELIPPSLRVNIEFKDRFFEEFGIAQNEDQTAFSAENGHQHCEVMSRSSSKPADHQALFGGNSDDHFRVGIKFTRKSIKLYSDFYSSDIIVASPIGLVTKIEEAKKEKEKDFDFLSSIEVLIVDHADVIAMQNWDHMNFVFKQINQIPSKQHGTDIMRIRKWYLDGHAQFYRQTILLSCFLTPEMNALFSKICLNYEGKVKLVREYKGILQKILLQVRQVYERFDATSAIDIEDARFDYFVQKVFPKIKDSLEGGIMIFTSSYFDFVRVRNFLKSQKASFCMLGEYTEESDKSRSRLWFFEGKRKIMLYTERAHFYFRYKIRGVKKLIIYSLPERKEFYPEIVNKLGEVDNGSCLVLFSRFDSYKLERIVGTPASKKMVSSMKNTFVFS
ncbi:protein NUCLEOLAR FACTOR 1 [Nymphaea colorata]|nr:protein NUCLEOLAR FACTOR 1 [Nymphaea colorata]